MRSVVVWRITTSRSEIANLAVTLDRALQSMLRGPVGGPLSRALEQHSADAAGPHGHRPAISNPGQACGFSTPPPGGGMTCSHALSSIPHSVVSQFLMHPLRLPVLNCHRLRAPILDFGSADARSIFRDGVLRRPSGFRMARVNSRALLLLG